MAIVVDAYATKAQEDKQFLNGLFKDDASEMSYRTVIADVEDSLDSTFGDTEFRDLSTEELGAYYEIVQEYSEDLYQLLEIRTLAGYQTYFKSVLGIYCLPLEESSSKRADIVQASTSLFKVLAMEATPEADILVLDAVSEIILKGENNKKLGSLNILLELVNVSGVDLGEIYLQDFLNTLEDSN